MPGLKIAKGLTLPLDSATKTFAILAQRRKGKTYTANVIAEEMVKAGQPWAALDPTGAWWGLRSSADGKREGLPILVVGGQHGQLPLERTAGKLLADLVVDEPGHYVFDMSLFESKAAEREFATAFAERLYRRKGKSSDPLHLFVDEADMFVPQRTPSGDQRMLGAFEAIVRRGGIRGIGTTLISQRAAVVNKNVLEQIDVLVALRTVGPNDQKALKAYIDAAGGEDERRELMGSLASLSLGEAWVWEPGADPPLFERVKIRERETFNSSATPKAGGKRVEPRKLADVDLAAIEEKIADTIERAKAEDPKALQKKVRELEQEIRKLKKQLDERPTEPIEIKVPAISDEALEEIKEAVEGADSASRDVLAAGERLGEVADQLADVPKMVLDQGKRVRGAAARDQGSPSRRSGARQGRSSVPRAARPSPTLAHPNDRANNEEGSSLSGPEQRVLDALAWLDTVGFARPSKIQVGFIAGYRVGKKVGGTFGNVLGQLRARGLLDYPSAGSVALTAAGEACATVPDIEQTPEGLQSAVMGMLNGPEQRVLQVLIDAYPEPMSKQDCGEAAGYTVGEKVGGTYGNILGRLRSLGLIDYPGPGEVVALPVLFLEGS